MNLEEAWKIVDDVYAWAIAKYRWSNPPAKPEVVITERQGTKTFGQFNFQTRKLTVRRDVGRRDVIHETIHSFRIHHGTIRIADLHYSKGTRPRKSDAYRSFPSNRRLDTLTDWVENQVYGAT